jgi:hypothetical protein
LLYLKDGSLVSVLRGIQREGVGVEV